MKAYSLDTIKKRPIKILKDQQKTIDDLRKTQNTWRGYLPLPVATADPPVTASGQFGLYYNSNTGKVRKSYNGGAWADTTI